MTAAVTAQHVRDALAVRYALPEWVLSFEVANGTGVLKTRSCDAMALNVYPSRGNVLLGFEIKVSRADWVRELRTPDKAEAYGHLCDQWWIVAPEGVVRDDELPHGWGLMILTDKGLRIRTGAADRPAAPWPRPFVAALLRSHARPAGEELKRARQEGIAEGRARATAETEQRLEADRKARQNLDQRLREFQAATGIDFAQLQWGDGDAALLRVANDIRRARTQQRGALERTLRSLEDARNNISSALAALIDTEGAQP